MGASAGWCVVTSPQDWQEARDAAVDSGSDGPYDPHDERRLALGLGGWDGDE